MAPPAINPKIRFWSKIVIIESGCWVWTAGKDVGGYGIFSPHRHPKKAHRWCYETYVAKVPDGMQLDHLCRNKLCVNPMHLEVVTPRENTLRGNTITAANAKKTRCHNGHPLSGDNLRTYNGRRVCKLCRYLSYLRRKAKL